MRIAAILLSSICCSIRSGRLGDVGMARSEFSALRRPMAAMMTFTTKRSLIGY
jgi:hypothetical protein